MADQTHAALVAAITDEASRKNVNGTPTIFVNGKSVTASTADVIGAINKAVKS